MKMKPIFFSDVEKDLVKNLDRLLVAWGERDFKVSTQKQEMPFTTQYVVRSDGGELLNKVLKAEDIALNIFLKDFTSFNAMYAEGKRLAALLEGVLPLLPKYSKVIAYVEDVSLNVLGFNEVSQVYTIGITFTVYHKGKNTLQ